MRASTAPEEMQGWGVVEQVSHLQAEYCSTPAPPWDSVGGNELQGWSQGRRLLRIGNLLWSPQPIIPSAPLTGQVDMSWLGGRRGWNWNFATRVENKRCCSISPSLSLAKVGLWGLLIQAFVFALCLVYLHLLLLKKWPVDPPGGNTQSTLMAEKLGVILFLSKGMSGLHSKFHLKLNGVSKLCMKPWHKLQDQVPDLA